MKVVLPCLQNQKLKTEWLLTSLSSLNCTIIQPPYSFQILSRKTPRPEIFISSFPFPYLTHLQFLPCNIEISSLHPSGSRTPCNPKCQHGRSVQRPHSFCSQSPEQQQKHSYLYKSHKETNVQEIFFLCVQIMESVIKSLEVIAFPHNKWENF